MAGGQDLDGDGYDDLAIGAPLDENGRGSVWLFRGAPAGPREWLRLTAPVRAPGDGFGEVVLAVGDMDGDGYSELAVSAPTAFADQDDAGVVVLFAGSETGPGVGELLDLGGLLLDEVGAALASGDVDGDGLVDLAVGAPGWDDNGIGAGAVHLVSGGELTALVSQTVFGDTADGASLGQALTSGDLDGDGYDDVVAGATDAFHIFFGGSDGLSDDDTSSVTDHVLGRGLGTALGAGGDVDGDGKNDLIVGLPGDDSLGEEAGAMRLFPGSAAGIDTTGVELITAFDGTAEARFGSSVALVPDRNGDGYDDAVIGAIYEGDSKGAVYLFHGAAEGIADDEQYKLLADNRIGGEHFGAALSTAGDLDGNGVADLIVGSPDLSAGGEITGQADLFLSCVDLDADKICAESDCDDEDGSIGDLRGTRFADADGDGFGDPTAGATACIDDPAYSDDATDCQDDNAFVFPGAAELDSATACMQDIDGDGYGADVPGVGVSPGTDCDDSDGTVNIAAAELVGDELDGNCDGGELCYSDEDGDGFSDGRIIGSANSSCEDAGEVGSDGLGDCDDTDAQTHPDAPDICGDGLDTNCDGVGLPDGDEDVDGLSWSVEERLGTSDCRQDSDDDGIPDDEEYLMGLDPANPDTDGDGLLDGEDPDPLVPQETDDGKGCATVPVTPWLAGLWGLMAVRRRQGAGTPRCSRQPAS